MRLKRCQNPSCKKYTMKKTHCNIKTRSAHPARFSPQDQFSRHRVTLKKRYNQYPVAKPDMQK